MSYAALQNLVGLQPDGITEVIDFQIVEHFRDSKGSIATQVFAPQASPAITFDNRIKHGLPVVRTVNIAGAQRAALQITMLVEDEQRMITCAAEVAVIS